MRRSNDCSRQDLWGQSDCCLRPRWPRRPQSMMICDWLAFACVWQEPERQDCLKISGNLFFVLLLVCSLSSAFDCLVRRNPRPPTPPRCPPCWWRPSWRCCTPRKSSLTGISSQDWSIVSWLLRMLTFARLQDGITTWVSSFWATFFRFSHVSISSRVQFSVGPWLNMVLHLKVKMDGNIRLQKW